MQRSFSWRV